MWLLQRPTGLVHVFVQLRKVLKAAEAKMSMEGRNAPGIWEYLLSSWPCLTPASLSSCPLNKVSGSVLLFALNMTLKLESR